MEKRFKLRFSRLFHSSFSSCNRSRNLSDIIEKAVFLPQNQRNFHLIEPVSPKIRPFPSIGRPAGPSETAGSLICSRDLNLMLPRRRVSESHSPFINVNGRNCHHISPISPLKTFYQLDKVPEQNKQSKKKSKSKKNKKKNKKKTYRETTSPFCPFSSSSMDTYFSGTWWSSSDDEEEHYKRDYYETETLFSSKRLSLSSDSSESRLQHRRRHHRLSRRENQVARPISDSKPAEEERSDVDLFPLQGKVKDSFAMVKKSSDPYNDFRVSMVEMIVEKQIFAAKDLEQLLQCFLSLNSERHHRVIVEVFTEIWEALFIDWGS